MGDCIMVVKKIVGSIVVCLLSLSLLGAEEKTNLSSPLKRTLTFGVAGALFVIVPPCVVFPDLLQENPQGCAKIMGAGFILAASYACFGDLKTSRVVPDTTLKTKQQPRLSEIAYSEWTSQHFPSLSHFNKEHDRFSLLNDKTHLLKE